NGRTEDPAVRFLIFVTTAGRQWSRPGNCATMRPRHWVERHPSRRGARNKAWPHVVAAGKRGFNTMTSRLKAITTVAAAGSVMLLAAAVQAQAPAGASAQAQEIPRTLDGKPDFTGVWTTYSGGGGRGAFGRAGGAAPGGRAGGPAGAAPGGRTGG